MRKAYFDVEIPVSKNKHIYESLKLKYEIEIGRFAHVISLLQKVIIINIKSLDIRTIHH